MQISAALAALTEALDDDQDLETTLHDFAIAAQLAVASYLGMTVTIIAGGHEISFTVREHQEAEQRIATSLLIPLTYLAAAAPGSFLVLYAATPGAFVDLAADLSYALHVEPDELTLDAHLTPANHHSGVTGLVDMSHINQAIGILIERGHTPHSASTELQHLASQAETTVRVAAHQLIQTASRRPGFDAA
jgi:hypothetical protein